MKQLLMLSLVVLMLPALAHPTPYVSSEEYEKLPAIEENFELDHVPSPLFYSYDPLNRLLMGADFIVTMQVSDTSSAAYGGIREGEHLPGIIQTDNTSESIWIWSRCYERTGMDTYGENVDAAWTYCMNNPAYGEEGGDDPVTGYYRVYNSSWALRASMEYLSVYGDTSYVAYAESCASYLCHHPMQLRRSIGLAKRLNCSIMGWAVGNLYEYGVFTGNSTYMDKAVAIADSLKDFAQVKTNCFGWDEWAMNGGAVMWGVVHSYFADDPESLEIWVETYAPFLDNEIDSSTYQNAWRGWAALGQYTAFDVLGGGDHELYFKHLADTLVLNDGDLDGGIPVIDAEPDTEDQSWVTNYLGFMCMDKMIDYAGIAAGQEAGLVDLYARAAPTPSVGLPSLNFMLAKPARVKINVYDVTGRSVVSKDLGITPAGSHSVPLDGGHGQAASAGIYFYNLEAGRRVASGKIVVLK
ncbi:MAG: T9SS type A sorting domain-containing protein [bacterium]